MSSTAEILREINALVDLQVETIRGGRITKDAFGYFERKQRILALLELLAETLSAQISEIDSQRTPPLHSSAYSRTCLCE
jgi:hypothetical protein